MRGPKIDARLRALALRLPAAAVLMLFAALEGCGDSVVTQPTPMPSNPFAQHGVGTDSTFEVVTWNLHNFAQSAGSETVSLAAKAIAAMNADVVALQEIAEPARFQQLVQALPGWTGVQATSDSYQNLAYVWREAAVTLGPGGIREIYGDQWRPFPRAPLLFDLVWNGHALLLIDNHLKCCGDGVLDVGDANDEETRRLDACALLAAWILAEAPDRAVVVLGDLNDRLDDAPANNVFTPFLDLPAAFRFADLSVATGPPDGWSYGPGQSHLDHLLVTDELFSALAAPASQCRTIRLDTALARGAYVSGISDHAPVALRLDLDE